MDSGVEQEPDEILDLIPVVLVCQQVDEFLEPLLGVLGQSPSIVAQAGQFGVEHIGGQEGSQIDDGLLGGWHEALGEGSQHLVGVHLLVGGALQGGIVVILGEQWLGVAIARSLPGAEARRHD